eukprot:XP_015572137.2 LOW QUALITY PROTEIN: GDSL esterase/lipase At2g30310-like [Ricinus communis]
MDSGNNNYILTWIKANYHPYGQDYAGGIPTGRFSNGKLIPDMLASILGIKETVPPFLDPRLFNDDLITGVNFASAGSGFDDSTSIFSQANPVSKQIELFRNYIERLKGIVGEEKALKIIHSALVILSAGTNDWFFNFYDIPARRLHFNVSGYQDFLLDKIHSVAKELYDLGCRSMVVSGLGPTGCLPVQMSRSLQNLSQRHCLKDQNRDSQAYNQKLVKLLSQMQATLPGSRIVYNDFYRPVIDMITYPKKYGFSETKKGCCGSGLLQVSFLCDPWTPTCEDPSKFLFWDMIHPTLIAYQYLVRYMVKDVLPKFF